MMKRLILFLPLLLLFLSAHAQQQYGNPVICSLSGSLPCLPNVQVGTGTQGMPAWQSFGTLNTDINLFNANFTQLYGMFGSSSHLASNGSATSSDIVGLWTGCATTAPYLLYSGTCAPVPAIAAGNSLSATGCSNSGLIGGANSSSYIAAGQFNAGVSGVCNITLTLPTLPGSLHAWQCSGSDTTSPAPLIQIAPLSTSACTMQVNAVSGDVSTFHATGY